MMSKEEDVKPDKGTKQSGQKKVIVMMSEGEEEKDKGQKQSGQKR